MSMLITNKQFSGGTQFGEFHYMADQDCTIINKVDHLLLFKGYLYPDLQCTVNDILEYLVQSKNHENKNLQQFSKFKGRYCGCFIDKKKRKVIIFTDQLGLQDVFYYFKDDELIISDSFVSFFNLKKFGINELDHIACGEFMLFEHVLFERTFLKDVKKLQYATLLNLDIVQHAEKKEQYWQYGFRPKKYPDREALFKKLDMLMHNAMQRIKDVQNDPTFKNSKKRKKKTEVTRYTIGLSGGLDSRVVAKYALEMGLDLDAFVFGHKKSDIFLISKRIAKKLGINLSQLEISPKYWSYHKKQLHYDPMMNLMLTTYGSVRDHLQTDRILLSGFNGDNIFGSHLEKEDFDHDLNYVEKICKKYALFDQTNDILTNDLFRSIMAEIAERYENLHMPDWQIKELFNFECRQLRFIKNNPSFHFYGIFDRYYSPFADIDVVEFALGLPLDELYQSKAYHEFIITRFPDMASIRPSQIPHRLTDPNIVRRIKSYMVKQRKNLDKKIQINLPIYRTITFTGALDWERIYHDFDFLVENRKLHMNLNRGIEDNTIMHLKDDVTNIRIKYHYLTIKAFIKEFIQ
jgi:asparagine synthetase B (glutamine-hydrolysing)